MTASSILQISPDYQWDWDSRFPAPDPGSAPNNCGPACITNLARFHRDIDFGIYATRRLAVLDPYRGTSANEQALMLSKRGVPAAVRIIDSLAQLRYLVGTSGRRPIVIGVLMSRIAASVRDHPFTGWHAIELMAWGGGGWWWRDPNFSRVNGRLDPDGGIKWMTDAQLEFAFIQNSPRYAIVSNSAKVIVPTVTYVNVLAGAAVRLQPYVTSGMSPSWRLNQMHRVKRAGTNKSAGSYSYHNGTSWQVGKTWVPIWWGGTYKRWVILPFVRATTGAGEDDDDLAPREEGLLEFDGDAPKGLRTLGEVPRLATAEEGDFIISQPVGGELDAPHE